MGKAIQVVVLTVLMMSIVIGFFYWRYVTNTETPYDEVGIAINGYMPGPIRDWGCGRLRETFGAVVPPYGCASDADPTAWR